MSTYLPNSCVSYGSEENYGNLAPESCQQSANTATYPSSNGSWTHYPQCNANGASMSTGNYKRSTRFNDTTCEAHSPSQAQSSFQHNVPYSNMVQNPVDYHHVKTNTRDQFIQSNVRKERFLSHMKVYDVCKPLYPWMKNLKGQC